jgi:AAA ATPase domain
VGRVYRDSLEQCLAHKQKGDQWMLSSYSEPVTGGDSAKPEMLFGVRIEAENLSGIRPVTDLKELRAVMDSSESGNCEQFATTFQAMCHRVSAPRGSTHSFVFVSGRLEPFEPAGLIQAALRELLTRLSDRHPLIVWIDDLQWVDRDSSAFLTELCSPPQQPSLLLILTYRSENVDDPTLADLRRMLASQKVLGTWQNIGLLPMSRSESSEFSAALLVGKAQLSEETVRKMLREADGHPLYIEQLITTAIASVVTAQIEPEPGDLQLRTLLQKRVAVMGESARQILEYTCLAARPLRLSVIFAAVETSSDTERAVALSVLTGQKLVRISGLETGRIIERDRNFCSVPSRQVMFLKEVGAGSWLTV